MPTEIEIDTIINTDRSDQNLRGLNKGLKELISLQSQVAAGSDQFKRLQKAINDTEGKIGDLKDSFRTLQGSGVERVNSSLGLLREGFLNADPEKLSIAMEGLGSAMKAIPIFLLIQAAGYLYENWEKLTAIFSRSAQQIKLNEEALKNLNEQVEINRTKIDNLLIYKNEELIALKRQEASYDLIIAKTKEINNLDQKKLRDQFSLTTREVANQAIALENLRESFRKDQLSQAAGGLTLLSMLGFNIGTSEKEVIEAERKLKELQVKAADAFNKQKGQQINSSEEIAQLQKEAALKAEEERRKAALAAIDTIVFAQEREIALENEKYRELVMDAKSNYALIEALRLKHAQNLYEIDTKYYIIARDLRLAEEDRDRKFLEDQAKRAEDAAKKQGETVGSVKDDIFLSTVAKGKNEFAIEQAALSRSLDGRIQLIENKRNSELATVTEGSQADIEINKNADEAIRQEKVKYNTLLLNTSKLSLNERIDLIKTISEEELENETLTQQQRIAIIEKSEKDILDLKIAKAEQYISFAQQGLTVLNGISDLRTQSEDYNLNQQQYSKDAALQNDSNRTEEKLNAERDQTQRLLDNDNLTSDQREAISKASEERQKNISSASKNAQLAINNDFTAKEIQIRKQQFERQKKLQLASAIIDLASAELKAIAEFGPPPSPLGIAALAAGAVIGGINIAKIASQKFDDGGASASASVSPVSSGGGSTPTLASSGPPPSFNPQAINSFTRQNDQSDIEKARAQRVYVLESDIRNASSKVDVYESRATFG